MPLGQIEPVRLVEAEQNALDQFPYLRLKDQGLVSPAKIDARDIERYRGTNAGIPLRVAARLIAG